MKKDIISHAGVGNAKMSAKISAKNNAGMSAKIIKIFYVMVC